MKSRSPTLRRMSPWWLLVGLAVLMIGLVKSGFGSGMGLIMVPLSALAMEHIAGYSAKSALAFLLPLLIVGDFIAIYQYRKVLSMRIVRRMLPGTALGVVLGALLLYLVSKQATQVAEALINIEIGIESVVLVGLQWYRTWRAAGELPVFRPSLWRANGAGLFAGASSTLAHAAGPIIALHLLPQRLDRRTFVGTCALYFGILNVSKLPAYWALGLFSQVKPAFSLMFLPLVIVGALMGLYLIRRLSDERFSRIIYGVTFVLGWYILGKGLMQLASIVG